MDFLGGGSTSVTFSTRQSEVGKSLKRFIWVCDTWRDSVPFVQFKKLEKRSWTRGFWSLLSNIEKLFSIIHVSNCIGQSDYKIVWSAIFEQGMKSDQFLSWGSEKKKVFFLHRLKSVLSGDYQMPQKWWVKSDFFTEVMTRNAFSQSQERTDGL